MDIGNIFEEWDFSGTIPLPYRVLLMGCIGVFAWASNLHILAHLRVDASNLLFSTPPLSSNYHSHNHARHREKFVSRSPLSTLYRSIYTLGGAFLAMTLVNMWMYKWVVAGSETKDSRTSGGAGQGSPGSMTDARGGMGLVGSPRSGIMVPILGYLSIIVMIFIPFNILFKKERYRFLRSMNKVLFSGFKSEVTFADVILADILTSFARVFGDLAVALCLMFLDRDGTNGDACYGSILVPIMTSIPYCVRLRQCLSEYMESNYTVKRHLMNALKYASAFPVIMISAMQKSAKTASVKGQPSNSMFSDNALFRLWLFFVALNSLYSFYWDIYHDWGLIQAQPTTRTIATGTMVNNALTTSTGSSGVHSRVSSGPLSPSVSKSSGSMTQNDGGNSSSSIANGGSSSTTMNNGNGSSSSNSPFARKQRMFGMRSYLHYEEPLFYVMAVVLDFLLRTTWMLKLVSNIQIEEYEGGVFTMECLEILRRWIWVLFRLESEMVKRAGFMENGSSEMGGLLQQGSESESGENSVILMEDLELWQK